MSISYEEALATLEAMFGEPWSRETLDKVLRIEKGHMENTCDRILNYGSQNDPQVLIDRLESGEPVGAPTANISADEELARQLAGQLDGIRKLSIEERFFVPDEGVAVLHAHLKGVVRRDEFITSLGRIHFSQ